MRRSGCKEKGKTAGAGGGKPGTVYEDALNSQSCVATGTHRSKPAGRVIVVTQPSVSQTELSEN